MAAFSFSLDSVMSRLFSLIVRMRDVDQIPSRYFKFRVQKKHKGSVSLGITSLMEVSLIKESS